LLSSTSVTRCCSFTWVAVTCIIQSVIRQIARRLSNASFDGVVIGGVAVTAAATLILANNHTDIGDAQSSPSIRVDLSQQRHLTQKVADELERRGVVVIPNVLNAAELILARRHAKFVIDEGRLEGVTGNAADVRQDTICLVRQSDGTPESTDSEARLHNVIGSGLSHCISLLRGTASRLESLGYSRSLHHRVPMQCQLAQYAGNGSASYVAHRDAAADNNFYQVGLLGWYVWCV
jgi:hypothetical protein